MKHLPFQFPRQNELDKMFYQDSNSDFILNATKCDAKIVCILTVRLVLQ